MKVAILGFGVEGKDAANYFLPKGADITIFDKKEESEVKIKEWKDKNFTWKCGPKYLKDGLLGFDLIVRSPGVYRFIPQLQTAEASGTKITSNTQIFFEECKKPIIGITGTKGKGTTARMTALALEAHGLKVVLGGNIGEPVLSHLEEANNTNWVVLELSSFQTIDLQLSPRITVVTNITTDHLDWHKDRKEYVTAKANLWAHQESEDFVVLNADDTTCLELSKQARSRVFLFSTREKIQNGAYAHAEKVYFVKNGQELKVGNTKDLQVPGEHNLSNSLAALTAAILASANLEKAWQGISSYSGYENRLEDLGNIDGVRYINDTASTHPESTIAAIKAYDQPKVLILGGSSKGVQFNKLAEEVVKTNVKAVLLIGQTAGEIELALKTSGHSGILEKGFNGMEDVVKRVTEIAESGDVALFSPGCASFGMFKNYIDRGEQFKKAVKNLNKGTP